MSNATKEFFDALAPGWRDNEMHSQDDIYRFLSDHVPLKAGMRVLDVGCGTGIISEPVHRMTGSGVLSIDLSSAMIEIAEKTHHNPSIEFRQCDFYDLDEGGFDALICFNAYPHFPDAAVFADKASEVLKEKGICAIIHNVSRKELSQHHKAIAKNVSRELKTATEEAAAFADKFDIVRLIDNDEMFLMLMRKK